MLASVAPAYDEDEIGYTGAMQLKAPVHIHIEGANCASCTVPFDADGRPSCMCRLKHIAWTILAMLWFAPPTVLMFLQMIGIDIL